MKKIQFLSFFLPILIISCNVQDTEELITKSHRYYLGIKTGDDYLSCYEKLQQLNSESKIDDGMYLFNEGTNNITEFGSRIDLYSEFQIIDKSSGESDTIVFMLSDSKLTYIYNKNKINELTSAPISLSNWPENSESENVIQYDNSTSEIAAKLEILESDEALQNRLTGILFSCKNLTSEYDFEADQPTKWTIVEINNADSQDLYSFDIYFKDGKVDRIVSNISPFLGCN